MEVLASALGMIWALILFICAATNLATLPGNWIMAALVLIWAFFIPVDFGGGNPGLIFFILFFSLAVLGEIVEFISQIWGGKKYGSSNKSTIFGMIGAIAGAIFCAPFFFGLGAIPGALGGAWLGSYISERLLENKDTKAAITAANGALLGRFLGMVVKFGLGVGMTSLFVAHYIAGWL